MVERRAGHIAVVSSVAGKVGAPLRTGYCAAKHAVIGYFDALRAEVEPAYGIKVSVIVPGSVRTSIVINALAGDGSTHGLSDENVDNGLDPDDLSNTILAGLLAGEREIVVAEGLELEGVRSRAVDPERVFALMGKFGEQLAEERAKRGPQRSMTFSRFKDQR